MTSAYSNRFPVNRKLLERLFKKITVSKTNIYKNVPCWEWQAYINKRGYGEVGFRAKKRNAYKVFYEIFVEIVPKGLELDHLCRNTRCVNPAHLEPVTHIENMRRGNSASTLNMKKTHCKYGHELSGWNLLPNKLGRRQCRNCLYRMINDKRQKQKNERIDKIR